MRAVGAHRPLRGFSALAPSAFVAGSFLVTGYCSGHCRMLSDSPTSTHEMLVTHTLLPVVTIKNVSGH